MTDFAAAGTDPADGSAALPPTADLVHAAQWAALRSWVDTVPRKVRDMPSVLDGWTIDHLLSHLARTVDAVAGLRPAPEAEPLSVQQYLAGFADRSTATSERTVAAAAASSADRSGELDAAYAQALRTLVALGTADPVVMAPGGPIRLGDFLETRIVELVVHGADLARSLVRAGDAAAEVDPPPVLDAAVERAAVVLYRAFRVKAGPLADDAALGRLAAAAFVDILAGRVPPPKKIPAAVRAQLPLF